MLVRLGYLDNGILLLTQAYHMYTVLSVIKSQMKYEKRPYEIKLYHCIYNQDPKILRETIDC